RKCCNCNGLLTKPPQTLRRKVSALFSTLYTHFEKVPAGKTTLLSILLDRMKAGGTLAGRPVRAGRAVVVSEESPAHWLLRSQKFDFAGHICWLCRPFHGKPRLDQWHALLDQLGALHEQVGLDLVVIDP